MVRSAPAGLGPARRASGSRRSPAWAAGRRSSCRRVGNVLPLPDEVASPRAPGIAFNYLTVHFGAAPPRPGWQPGETVLVHGASGGIGVATLQLAKAYGARTIAVVSTEAKEEAAREAGADEVVLADGFLARVKELTGGRGVDVVMDPVGGDRFTDSLRSLAPEGRILVVGFTGGEIPTVKVNRLLLNNVDVLGVGWGAFLAVEPAYLQEQWAELCDLLSLGAVVPRPSRPAYYLADAARRLRDMDARTLTGKVVLTVRARLTRGLASAPPRPLRGRPTVAGGRGAAARCCTSAYAPSASRSGACANRRGRAAPGARVPPPEACLRAPTRRGSRPAASSSRPPPRVPPAPRRPPASSARRSPRRWRTPRRGLPAGPPPTVAPRSSGSWRSAPSRRSACASCSATGRGRADRRGRGVRGPRARPRVSARTRVAATARRAVRRAASDLDDQLAGVASAAQHADERVEDPLDPVTTVSG